MPKSGPAKPTAYDVARLAGVSQSAVSRAFTPGGSVAASTREKINKAAATLGYRPNAIARSLITKRSNLIGVAVGHMTNPYLAAVLEELSRQLAQAGLHLLLLPADSDTRIKQVLQYRLESLIMLSTPPSPELAEECNIAGIPIINFNRASNHPQHPAILGDNVAGARMLAAYLVAGGHQRYGFISAGEKSTASMEREAGFTGYLTEQGIPLTHRGSAKFSVDVAAAAARRMLLQPDRPDAIFCANDHVAMTAIQVAQSEFGLEIGRELSIVGFDDVPQAAWPGVSLTTYSQPIHAVVERIVEVIGAFRAGEIPDSLHIVPGDLIIRSSARRPKLPLRFN